MSDYEVKIVTRTQVEEKNECTISHDVLFAFVEQQTGVRPPDGAELEIRSDYDDEEGVTLYDLRVTWVNHSFDTKESTRPKQVSRAPATEPPPAPTLVDEEGEPLEPL